MNSTKGTTASSKASEAGSGPRSKSVLGSLFSKRSSSSSVFAGEKPSKPPKQDPWGKRPANTNYPEGSEHWTESHERAKKESERQELSDPSKKAKGKASSGVYEYPKSTGPWG